MRTLRCLLLIALAACEEHGSSPCAPLAACIDAEPFPVDDGGIIGPDAACFDAFEPNDTIQSAFLVPLVGQGFDAIGINVCPDMDRDHFAVDLPANANLAAIVASDGLPMRLSILNAAGTSIANGMSTGPTTEICAPNLPAGTFFVVAFTDGGGIVTNYRLSIQLVPSC